MIKLQPNTALMIYLGFTLAVLLGIWTWSHLKTRKKKVNVDSQKLFVCEFCHFAYLDDGLQQVTKCPQCQSYNKDNHYKKNSHHEL